MKTLKDFEEGYANRSNMTVDELHKLGLKARPCDCGEGSCKGWQMISDESWEQYKKIHGIKENLK